MIFSRRVARLRYYQDPATNSLKEWTGWRAAYWTEAAGWRTGSGSAKVALVAGGAQSVRAPRGNGTGYAEGLDYRWVVRPEAFGGTTGLLRLAWNRLKLTSCGDAVDVYGGAVDGDGTWDATYAAAGRPALVASYGCGAADPPAAWLVGLAATGFTVRLRSSGGARSGAGAVDFAYASDAAKYDAAERDSYPLVPAVLCPSRGRR